jgi:acetylornithine deacetylase
MAEFTESIEMNVPRFMGLLKNLIGESVHLQNSPAQGLIPREELAANHVLEVLAPFTKENGGVLEVQKVNFVEGRSNVVIKYPGTTDEVCSFVGSHLDVVPADAANWSRNPFELTIEGDSLYGRGTTDCLGHVAMLTDLMASLAERKPTLRQSVVVIFIANEENGTFRGVGVDQLNREGYLDALKKGPLFWVDAADSQPCIGTCGSTQWELKFTGRCFHSGLPHKGINAIEFAMDTVNYIQSRFFTDFPRDKREDEYNFATQSTFKPNQISCSVGALNQVPGACTVQGDIRSSPFYNIKEMQKVIQGYVDAVNTDPSIVENPTLRGPHSKYTLPSENMKGTVTLKWLVEAENGVACKLDSHGHLALLRATEAVLGNVKPYSIGGSLPLIRDLQEDGFDVQISGYGISSR